MAGRLEQKRRAAAEQRAAKRARNRALVEVLELAEQGNLDLVVGFCQSELGITKPLEEVRRELREQMIH